LIKRLNNQQQDEKPEGSISIAIAWLRHQRGSKQKWAQKFSGKNIDAVTF